MQNGRADGRRRQVRPEHWPVAGALLVLGLPPSSGAGLLPEHDSAPLTELPATRVPPLLPVMVAGPPMVFPDTVTRPPLPATWAGPLMVAPPNVTPSAS